MKITKSSAFKKHLKRSLSISLLGLSASVLFSPAIHSAEPVTAPKLTSAASKPLKALSDPLLSVDMNRAKIVSQVVSRWQGDVATAKRGDFSAELAGLRADQLLAVSLAASFDGVLDVLDGQTSSKQPVGGLSLIQASKSGSQTKALGDAAIDLAYTPLTPCRLLDTRTGQTSALGQLGGTFTPNTVRSIVPAGACGIPAAGVKNLFVGFTTINNTPNSGGFLSLLGPGAPLTTSNDIFNIGAQLSSGSSTVPTGTAGQFDIFVATAIHMSSSISSAISPPPPAEISPIVSVAVMCSQSPTPIQRITVRHYAPSALALPVGVLAYGVHMQAAASASTEPQALAAMVYSVSHLGQDTAYIRRET